MLGPSGSGKTTTPHDACRLRGPRLHPSGGGSSIDSMPPHKRDMRHGVPELHAFSHMTMEESLALRPASLGKAAIEARIKRALHMVGRKLRIPTKPAMHSNSKPAGYSDLKPTTRGVVRMGQFHDVVEGWEGQETG